MIASLVRAFRNCYRIRVTTDSADGATNDKTRKLAGETRSNCGPPRLESRLLDQESSLEMVLCGVFFLQLGHPFFCSIVVAVVVAVGSIVNVLSIVRDLEQ